MALINCPECGEKYSDTTISCPHCGYVEYEEEYVTEGILSIVIGIIAWVIAIYINGGLLLVLPFLMFCCSIILERKCLKQFSLIGFLISVSGIVLLSITFIKDFLIL